MRRPTIIVICPINEGAKSCMATWSKVGTANVLLTRNHHHDFVYISKINMYFCGRDDFRTSEPLPNKI